MLKLNPNHIYRYFMCTNESSREGVVGFLYRSSLAISLLTKR